MKEHNCPARLTCGFATYMAYRHLLGVFSLASLTSDKKFVNMAPCKNDDHLTNIVRSLTDKIN